MHRAAYACDEIGTLAQFLSAGCQSAISHCAPSLVGASSLGRWTGAWNAANVFLVESLYHIMRLLLVAPEQGIPSSSC